MSWPWRSCLKSGNGFLPYRSPDFRAPLPVTKTQLDGSYRRRTGTPFPSCDPWSKWRSLHITSGAGVHAKISTYIYSNLTLSTKAWPLMAAALDDQNLTMREPAPEPSVFCFILFKYTVVSRKTLCRQRVDWKNTSSLLVCLVGVQLLLSKHTPHVLHVRCGATYCQGAHPDANCGVESKLHKQKIQIAKDICGQHPSSILQGNSAASISTALQQHQHAGSKAHAARRIWQRHPREAPCSGTSISSKAHTSSYT